jgi:uncharacterized phiE125 gp8 family phage protein
MMTAGTAEAIVTLAEAQAFARVETGDEEALLAALIRTASNLCEAFLGQVVIERGFTEQLSASHEWQRLDTAPVRSIDGVAVDGVPLDAGAYATDIDASGRGWVRLAAGRSYGVMQVSGSAGMASGQNDAPEAVRHGVLRLVTHLFAARDGDGGEIPAAVSALWRPYRRMRLA